MDAYKTYQILPEELAHDNAGNVNLQEMWAYVRKRDLNLAQFFLLNHFQAGLPTELRRVLNLQNQDKLKLSNAVKLATIEARSRDEAKCASKVYITSMSDKEAQIDAFQQGASYNRQTPKRFTPQQPRKNNPQHQQSKSSWRTVGQATMQTEMARHVSFARCKITVRRSTVSKSRLTSLVWTPMASLVWTPMAAPSGQKIITADSNPTALVHALDFSFQDFQY